METSWLLIRENLQFDRFIIITMIVTAAHDAAPAC